MIDLHKKRKKVDTPAPRWIVAGSGLCVILLGGVYFFGYGSFNVIVYDRAAAQSTSTSVAVAPRLVPVLDTVAYDKKLVAMANMGTSTGTTTARLWPAKAVYPNVGALLPFNRILAYYGNFYSTRMGILGEFEEDVVLQKLRAAVKEWDTADPSTPVVPAIEYIAITAQKAPIDGTYRARMPHAQIDRAVAMAKKINGIVILDVQVGLSTLQQELPLLEKYWKMPEVHLALDPEFSMKTGAKPGTVIGSFDAKDINYAANYLAEVVQENNIPPKILIVHRFTQPMVTNASQIKPLPEVQIVMVMDGWGSPIRKIGTYQAFIYTEPVQFTGFKIFYKNDLRPPSTRILTPQELLKLKPQPVFIQYQ